MTRSLRTKMDFLADGIAARGNVLVLLVPDGLRHACAGERPPFPVLPPCGWSAPWSSGRYQCPRCGGGVARVGGAA